MSESLYEGVLADAYALAVFKGLRRLQQATEVHAKRLARYGGLTPLQLLILRIMAGQGELTASRLAREVSLTQASLSGVLDRLESRGLLSRRRDERDRRKHWLVLTEQGLDALAAAPSLLPEHVLARFATLAEWERHSLLAALLRAAELFDTPENDEEEE
ncbi:TPA: winged helix-turn-helix transcriptional regulator [Pseudomonas aeruginosa]|nr:winged helix-turn-helix transcriptional regulator [Pseudomonas aeruginosa]